MSVHPEVFKKVDLLKVLPEAVVKELKKSTNVDSEKYTYSEFRDVVTTDWAETNLVCLGFGFGQGEAF